MSARPNRWARWRRAAPSLALCWLGLPAVPVALLAGRMLREGGAYANLVSFVLGVPLLCAVLALGSCRHPWWWSNTGLAAGFGAGLAGGVVVFGIGSIWPPVLGLVLAMVGVVTAAHARDRWFDALGPDLMGMTVPIVRSDGRCLVLAPDGLRWTSCSASGYALLPSRSSRSALDSEAYHRRVEEFGWGRVVGVEVGPDAGTVRFRFAGGQERTAGFHRAADVARFTWAYKQACGRRLSRAAPPPSPFLPGPSSRSWWG